MKVSIIVPVLNEPGLIHFVTHLRERAPEAELILVRADGSEDISESVAKNCDRILTAKRGRGVQMNAGASVASGDVLWFLHADCELPLDCLEAIARALAKRDMVGGCFRIWFARRQLIYRVSDAIGNICVDLFGRCYGDHGIFCRHDIFFAIGGFPNVTLFEDAEFYHSLGRRGRTRQLNEYILPSPRRYENLGPYRLTAAYTLLSVLYILRMPIPFLAKLYGWLCLTRNDSATA